MKLKLVGNMLVITSSVKTEAFKRALVVEPNTNTVVDGVGNEVFKLKFDETKANPQFNEYSATFNQVSEEGNMMAVVALTPSEDYNKTIVEIFGNTLNATKTAEELIAKQVEAVNQSMDELLESIE